MFYLTNLFLHTFIIRKDTHFYIKIAFAAKKVFCGHYISRPNRRKTTKKQTMETYCCHRLYWLKVISTPQFS